MSEETTPTRLFLRELSLFLAQSEKGQESGMSDKSTRDFSNDELCEGILQGNLQVFRYIQAKTFPTLLSLVRQTGGSRQDAENLFYDALVVVFKKLSQGSLQIDCKFTTYFLGVCKLIWKFKRNSYPVIHPEIPDVTDNEEKIEEIYRESREFRLYRKHFRKLKEKHQKLLNATLTNKPYSELYSEFGYKSADVFKNVIARIKKRLIENIMKDPEYAGCNGKKNWSV